jgi:hypothetical protein
MDCNGEEAGGLYHIYRRAWQPGNVDIGPIRISMLLVYIGKIRDLYQWPLLNSIAYHYLGNT